MSMQFSAEDQLYRRNQEQDQKKRKRSLSRSPLPARRDEEWISSRRKARWESKDPIEEPDYIWERSPSPPKIKKHKEKKEKKEKKHKKEKRDRSVSPSKSSSKSDSNKPHKHDQEDHRRDNFETRPDSKQNEEQELKQEEESDDDDMIGPMPDENSSSKPITADAGKTPGKLPGPYQNVAHTADKIEQYEHAGFVMTGNRNKIKYKTRIARELMMSLEKDRKGLAKATLEDKNKREQNIMEELKNLYASKGHNIVGGGTTNTTSGNANANTNTNTNNNSDRFTKGGST